MDATIGVVLEQLHYGGRAVAGFGLRGGVTQIDSTSVLSALGADPDTVYNAYQAQQGFQHMANVYGQMTSITSTRDDCVKGCGGDLNCQNGCSKAAVLSLESLATGIATVFNPLVGLAIGALFQVLNQVFGFAQGVPDPDCPNGPNPWPPSATDQTTLANATATIFAGTTGPSGVAAPNSVTDPFLLSVMLFRAQQSALIENCHWDQALSGSGVLAAEALMLRQWNLQHLGSPQTVTRTVWTSGPAPADADQWTFFITDLYLAQNPKGQNGDQASVTVNYGAGLNPQLIQQAPGGATTTSPAKKVALVGATTVGLGAGAIWAYAASKGISFYDAWKRLTHAVTGGR